MMAPGISSLPSSTSPTSPTSIYPQSLDQPSGQHLAIAIQDPKSVVLSDGSVEVELMPGDEEEDQEFGANIAEELDDEALYAISSQLLEDVETDIQARKEWVETFVEGLDILGFKYEERSEPWDGACGVFSSVLSEAAIRFQAETMSETFPAAGPVRTKILGKVDKDKEQAAKRVQDDMNYQLTERMVEYRAEHERMLFALGLAGSAFKKVYFDPTLGRQVALFIPAEDVIVPYGASHIEMAERVTHVMRKTKNEVDKLIASGFYKDVELGEPRAFPTDVEKKKAEDNGFTLTDDERYTLYEVHADLVIDGLDEEKGEDTPLAKPYVITVDKSSEQILSIRRNWNEDDELKLKRNHFVHYVYVPGYGFYGLGLIHIVGGYARAGTSLIRQLVDAGTLSNLPGGLKSRGLRIKGDDTPINPGEFRDVDVPSGSIKDNIMPLPYKEPSQVLLALLEKVTEEGRRLGAISDMNVSDMSTQAPVGTTLAIMEQTLKPIAAVQSRVHFALKQELKLLKEIIADYAPEDYQYQPEWGLPQARKVDYSLVEVIPVSDPNSSTMAQRVIQYQAVFQMAQNAAQIYDLPYLHRQMIEALGVKNADKIVPTSEDQKPRDPVSENMSALVGKPLKSFLYQDHDSHIAVHQAFMQDPMVAAAIGQNPMAQQIMASLQAHIAEHTSFSYYKQMEEKMGVSLPPPDQEMPEDMEVQLSKLLADAGKQLAQAHQQQAQQQQAQQQQQDPLFQLEMQKAQAKQAEVQVKQSEVQRKTQKDQADIQLAQQKMQLEQAKTAASMQNDQLKTQLQHQQATQRMQFDAANALAGHEHSHNQFQHTVAQSQQPQQPPAQAKPTPKGKK